MRAKKHLALVTNETPKPRPPRPRNIYSDAFEDGFKLRYDGEPYQRQAFDFVHLNKLLKLHEGAIVMERWCKAISNYFLTPQGKHTLADLCCNYAAFVCSPRDRFGKPINVPVANGNYTDQKTATMVDGIQRGIERIKNRGN
jgi:hypothetical protein